MADVEPVNHAGLVVNYMTAYLTKSLGWTDWPKHMHRIRHSRSFPLPDDESGYDDWQFSVPKRPELTRARIADWSERGYQVIETDHYTAWQIVESIG